MKKKQLFSLRKLSVGIASVSLGTLVFLGGAQAANAEDAATTQADKDAQAVNAQVELAKKAGAELDAKDNTQKQVETAQNVSKEQVDKAQAEINALNGISKETKDIYNKKVADAATADIPGIVQDAKAVNAQVELAQNAAKEQEAQAKAARELNTLTQVAYNTVNNLHNLTDQQKDAFNQQILNDSGNNNGQNLKGIVTNARQLDTNNGNEKHAREAGANTVEKKEAKDLETLTTVAIDQVNGLHNLTDQQKEAFVKQIKNDSANNKGQNLKGIVTNARQLDTNNGNEKHAREAGANTGLSQDVAEKVKKAHNEVDALKNSTPEQKAAAHSKLNDDARNNVNGMDKVVKDAKALDAKQAPKKDPKNQNVTTTKEKTPKNQETKNQNVTTTKEKTPKNQETKNQNVTTTKEKTPKNQETKNQGTTKQGPAATTGNGKVAQAQPGKDQTAKVTTEQKTGQNLAQAKVTKDEAKAQQKAEAAKKQLPETGEQDQVLFGMLAGTLFASAGTLFLVQARRKENE
ncbi:YSIRK signal domain/LPXTG anchor domain surface protein [Staphylococcus carnosus]|uniref:Gram-positive cocci surface proteins LPxTG domain-containing protein n=1 Tax=Staphylococcus carnosus TaxID=1281 RepID=A0AAJ0JPU3_STACA|nr:YSIRK signal domain/LPXTG anchor domain surface protein [Staphylococcus carnosus]KKB25804.1 hypothetical protein VV61_04330 [Staphylococcus carnosus]QQS86457.1 YSIRK signal domain/LPXTG anchor domain surface protein [Staphylococcus carnosus]UTB99615.1 hypothetical protein A7E59_01985 [Staphylococcus carnosus]UTC03592.1 hypothetical protein A2I68_10800 [Staphylococcus carnosus]